MEIMTGTNKHLEDMIFDVKMRIIKSESLEEQYALVDHLNQLQELLENRTGKNSFAAAHAVLGPIKRQKQYFKYLDEIFDRFDENFIRYKKEHKELFGQVLDTMSDELEVLDGCGFGEDNGELTKEEFYQYFFEFLQQYGLEGRFDKLIQDGRIFNRVVRNKSPYVYQGACLYDVGIGDTSILLNGFRHNTSYLMCLGHEFGHLFDFERLNVETRAHDILHYSYISCYGEVLSCLFEKLFYDFMFDKKYRPEAIRDDYINRAFLSNAYVMGMYALTLINDKAIRKGLDDVPKREILRQIKSELSNDDEIRRLVDDGFVDLAVNPKYSYGEFIAEILKDNIQSEGLDSLMMRRFMEARCEPFKPEQLEEFGFTLEGYQKVYRKDSARVKNTSVN